MSTSTTDRTDALLKNLEATGNQVGAAKAYKFHWVVENRIPTSYGRISFVPVIGTRGLSLWLRRHEMW
jgi:hypothetical protein